MTDIDGQLRHVFNKHGIAVKQVRENEKIDGRWRVKPQADGSDEQYLRPVGEVGASKPVDHQLHFAAVRATLPAIDGSSVLGGTVTVDGTDGGEILLTVE